MTEACHDCDRPDCPTLTMPPLLVYGVDPWPRSQANAIAFDEAAHEVSTARKLALHDCHSHRKDWRAEALTWREMHKWAPPEADKSRHEDKDGAALYDAVDDAMMEGKYRFIDLVLSGLDPTRLDTVVALGWLTITGTVPRDYLPSRADYYARFKKHLEATLPERVERILVGLE